MCSHEAKMYHPKPVRKLAATQIGILVKEQVKCQSAIIPKSKDAGLSSILKPAHCSQLAPTASTSAKVKSRKHFVDSAISRFGLDFSPSPAEKSEVEVIQIKESAVVLPMIPVIETSPGLSGLTDKKDLEDKVDTLGSSTKQSLGGLETETDAKPVKRAPIMRCRRPLYQDVSTHQEKLAVRDPSPMISNFKDSTWLRNQLETSADSLDNSIEDSPSSRGQERRPELLAIKL